MNLFFFRALEMRCAELQRAGLLDQVAPSTWTTPWVVHAQPAGRGQRVLDYLGRYVFRIAIANSRLEEMTDDDVTFRYQDNRTHETRRVTLPGVEFLQRFLQHVLPRGCAKVRYYGLWSAAHRADRTRARALAVPSPHVKARNAIARIRIVSPPRKNRPIRSGEVTFAGERINDLTEHLRTHGVPTVEMLAAGFSPEREGLA